jgi:hypothetical protein
MPLTVQRLAAILVLAGTAHSAVRGQEIPRGTVVDDVRCVADASQGYALYVPSDYTPDRAWSVLMGFHPGARGRAMVDAYRTASERYGYIVAGSNNSRNGSWPASAAAVRAMSIDLGKRFAIDAERVYLAGMSGGARVALQVALDSKNIAGVIASSAGFADDRPRRSVPFALFGTAGTEDFNYVEMRLLDRTLSSPHRLAVFTGGHTLPPERVAVDAIEWMELQAMKTGRREKDEALIDRLIVERRRLVAASPADASAIHGLRALVADFEGLRDVSADAARMRELSQHPAMRQALDRERTDDERESRAIREIVDLEARLFDAERRGQSLARLRDRLSRLSRAATAEGESAERSQARRVLRAVALGAAERAPDPEYRKLLDQLAPRGR